MNSLKDLFIFLEKFVPNWPIIIETGIQNDFNPDNMDHYSTINLLKYIVVPKNGILCSFDIEKNHIDKCRDYLLKTGSIPNEDFIKFILGNSVEKLKESVENTILYEDKRGGIDIVFLDSKEFDEDHMLNELKILEKYLNKRDGYIIMCDDIHNSGSVKWKKAVPYIKEKGLRDGLIDFWFEYDTPTGLFVGIKNGER